MSNIIYPNIPVKLSDTDGNAIALVSKVRQALGRNGVATTEQARFQKEALSGDYDHVIGTCMDWVNIS